MKKELVYGIAGLVVGAAISGAVVWALTSSKPSASMEHTMNDEIAGKTGDAFDKAFLEAMISHHEAALTMAEEAKTNAEHPELKLLAEEILLSQSKEVQQMKAWQVAWGYGASNQDHSTMHQH